MVPTHVPNPSRQRTLPVAALLLLTLLATSGATANDWPQVPPDPFGADCYPVALWGASDHDAAASVLISDLDLTGDGQPDLVAGVPRAKLDGNVYGAVYIVTPPAPAGSSLAAAHTLLKGPSPGAQGGRSIASAGDINGDGITDLVIGAPITREPGKAPSGAAFVFHGPLAPGTRSMWDADVVLLGGTDHAFGAGVAGVGDVNGDGHDDLLIGAPGLGTVSDRHGGAFLFHGPLSGTLQWHEADRMILGKEPNGQAGFAVAATPDLDGDGRPDLAIAAPYARGARGTVHLVHAAQLDDPAFDLSASAATLTGEPRGSAGVLLLPIGDTDGDGTPDLLVGAPTTTLDGNRDQGAVYLVSGATEGSHALAEAAVARFVGAPTGAKFGTSAAVIGDLDADGRDDLAIGAPATGRGTVYLYSGYDGVRGNVTAASADHAIAGRALYDNHGMALAGGDLDQDGRPDLVVSVPGEDGVGAVRGAIRHFDRDPMVADRDDDGLLDGCETGRYGTDPDHVDTDRDGLFDSEEALVFGSDPLDRDTDGDLHSDLAEVTRHTDPTNPFSFPILHHPFTAPIPPPFQEIPIADDEEPIY